MSKQFELLAPGGDVDSVKAAILAGADAVYCGLDKFNARNRAVNISLENLHGLIRIAHEHDCKIFITLNIIILESEIPEVIRLLNKLVNIDIDGVILQDLGLFHIIKQHFPTLDVHASTQLNTHNQGQIDFLAQLQASRVNLSRELNIQEIKYLAEYGRERNVLMEVFVHGSYCIGFSGLCYISSARNGNSGNRGRCSQPCRDQYQPTKIGSQFPLNMKDNSAFDDLKMLADAGAYSLKIEGRIKKPHYVYTVADQWRKQIDNFCQTGEVGTNKETLYKEFNRDFSDGYLTGDINKNMFIDNPRSNTVAHFSKVYQCTSESSVKELKQSLYSEKTTVIQKLEEQSNLLNIDKLSVELFFSGAIGLPLTLRLLVKEGNQVKSEHQLTSEAILAKSDKRKLSQADFAEKFNPINNDKFVLVEVNVADLEEDASIPFKQLSELRDQVLLTLNNGKSLIAPVEVADLGLVKSAHITAEATPISPKTSSPKLSIMISDEKDIAACDDPDVDVYFHLPSAMKVNLSKLVALFTNHPNLLPYFPAILIGEDFDAAVDFIDQIKPSTLITNNTGIGFEAKKRSIAWVAGPQLNMTNSYALRCLQQEFAAGGAFISNEINKKQLRNIVRPVSDTQDFKTFYSIYHPMTLLTSRQCLFQSTIGCKIKKFDSKCLKNCKKHTSIINLNSSQYVIDKQKGDHNHMFNHLNYLNVNVLKDLPQLATDVFVDLRNIKTDTQVKLDKPELIKAFKALIKQDESAVEMLTKQVSPTTSDQYRKGL
ncbi:MAG: peptidase U32 family protein [Vibrio sp.]